MYERVQKISHIELAKSIKKYKDIHKLIGPIVKRYFETYFEEYGYFSDWVFDDNGENVIINYSYLDYNDNWEYDSIDLLLDKIIEMI